MKLKKIVAICSVMGLCTIGFAANAQASYVPTGRVLNCKSLSIVEKLNFVHETVVRSESVTEVAEEVVEETYSNPCAYGHENCDGTHMNANQDGTGMGYHHQDGNGYQNNENRGHRRGNHHN